MKIIDELKDKRKVIGENEEIEVKENGITLIALVITIIVLLILTGVTIATLTGQNGILTRTNDAKEDTAKETAKEKVAVEILGSYGDDGKLDYGLLEDNLNNIKGIQGVPSPITDDSFPIKVIVDGYEVTIEDNGNVTVGDKNDNPPSTTGKTDGSFDDGEGVNTPKLSSNMQLVVYNNGEWIEDTTKSAYKYEAQSGTTENRGTSEWANAKVTINEVESYFVWIPRYAYKIDSTNKTIDIKFIKDTGTMAADGVTECKYANDPTLNTDTDYIIHPAFTTNADLGGGWDTELLGLWIGKYETSQSDAGTTKDEMGSSGIIQVKPNVTSWRSMTVGEMYEKAEAYSTDLKSHMLKNSEWGAVAYLTHSKYGRNGTEIAINNSSDYITGTSGGSANASSSDATYEYNNMTNGVLASSTGNVYGIYDLSGGAWEYAASYYSGSSNLSNGSQLVNEINREYVTAYNGTGVETDYKQGDATKETKGWNGDSAAFVSADHPFFDRGGYCFSTSNAGVFYFSRNYGSSDSGSSFRVCLAV